MLSCYTDNAKEQAEERYEAVTAGCGEGGFSPIFTTPRTQNTKQRIPTMF